MKWISSQGSKRAKASGAEKRGSISSGGGGWGGRYKGRLRPHQVPRTQPLAGVQG